MRITSGIRCPLSAKHETEEQEAGSADHRGRCDQPVPGGLERAAWRPAFGNAGTVLSRLSAQPPHWTQDGGRTEYSVQAVQCKMCSQDVLTTDMERDLRGLPAEAARKVLCSGVVAEVNSSHARNWLWAAPRGFAQLATCFQRSIAPHPTRDDFLPAVSHHAAVGADSVNAAVRSTRSLAPESEIGLPSLVCWQSRFHLRFLQGRPLARRRHPSARGSDTAGPA